MILTESLQLVEADSALAMSGLDAACVEDVITFKQPDFLFVPLEIESQLAVVTPVALVDHTTLQVAGEDGAVTLHVPLDKSFGCKENLFSV